MSGSELGTAVAWVALVALALLSSKQLSFLQMWIC